MVSERTSNPPTERGSNGDDSVEDAPILERTVAEGLDERDSFTDVPEVSIGTLFELLSHPGRRYVLSYVLATEGHATCAELVDYVVTRTDSTMTPGQFRERVAAQLTHTHFPKLAGANLLEYNVERQIVETTEYTDAVRPFLELSFDYERRRLTADDAE